MPSPTSRGSLPSIPPSLAQSAQTQAHRDGSRETGGTRAEAGDVEWVEESVEAIPLAIDVQALEQEAGWDGQEVGHLPWMHPHRKAEYLHRSLRPADE